MANIRRYDRNLVKQMIAFVKRMERKKRYSKQDVLCLIATKFRATAREICAALFYIWLSGGEPDTDWMQFYVEFKRRINADDRRKDDQIISIRERRQTLDGKVGTVWINVLASGEDAARAAKENEKPRDGYNRKIKDLRSISKDTKLRKRQLKRLAEAEAEDRNEGTTEEERK